MAQSPESGLQGAYKGRNTKLSIWCIRSDQQNPQSCPHSFAGRFLGSAATQSPPPKAANPSTVVCPHCPLRITVAQLPNSMIGSILPILAALKHFKPSQTTSP